MISYKAFLTLILSVSFFVINSCSSDDEVFDPPTTDDPIDGETEVEFYLTTPNEGNLVSLQESGVSSRQENEAFTINVDESETYQSMDGFGYTLTGGSALHINNMSFSARNELLNDLFGPDGVHSSYLRVSIGASDLDEAPFSYNDLPTGQTDPNLENFSIDPDRTNLIPVLQEIIAINPDIKIMGSPWSPPVWMKDNGSTVGGELLPEYYGVYADYFVKYIQAMQEEGISIDAVTVQNEPENPFNNPSLFMTAEQQTEFIANHLGPAFENANISTKIIIFDHNPDNINYPLTVLNNDVANAYVDGSAFHLYAGQINSLSAVHNAHPDKNIYFSEQWIEAPGDFPSDMRWHMRELIIGATRNWSRTVLEWNLAADPENRPHTDGGCTQCLGAVTIAGNEVTKNSAYYIIKQASKFVKQGSVRIDSNTSPSIQNVAFKTPDDDIVVIVLNDTDQQQDFNINVQSNPITTRLPAGSAGTYVWRQN
ncbi:MAG: glucosylceramidase [Flavobacteriaceae bacterium]|nr:glucosylceramidase [Flavobacteriaceae bacterium]